MTDINHTYSGQAYSDKRKELRPWVIAVMMIAAGLGLLFWDNDPSDGKPAPLVVISQIR